MIVDTGESHSNAAVYWAWRQFYFFLSLFAATVASPIAAPTWLPAYQGFTAVFCVLTLWSVCKLEKWMLFFAIPGLITYGAFYVRMYIEVISAFDSLSSGRNVSLMWLPWLRIIPPSINGALLFLGIVLLLAILFSKTRERRISAWIGGIAGILLTVPLVLKLPIDFLGEGHLSLLSLFFIIVCPGIAIGGAIGNVRTAKGLHTDLRRLAQWTISFVIVWMLCFMPFWETLRYKVTTISQMEHARDVKGLLWKIDALYGKNVWYSSVTPYASVDPEGALRDKRKAVRYEAAIAIASGGDNRRAIPVLLEAMSEGALNGQPDRSGGYAFQAAQQLSYFQDPRALPYLAQALSNGGPRDDEDAVFAIGLIPGQQSTELLAKALKSKSSNVRSNAARELAERGDTRSLPVLAELMRTGGWYERQSEVWSVSGIRNDIVIPLLKQAAKDPDGRVRKEALENLEWRAKKRK